MQLKEMETVHRHLEEKQKEFEDKQLELNEQQADIENQKQSLKVITNVKLQVQLRCQHFCCH